MKVKFAVATASAAVAAAAMVAGTAATGTANTAPTSWPRTTGAAAAAPNITGAQVLRFESTTVHSKAVKAGSHFGPGSYVVFEDVLRNGSGQTVGSDAVRCTANFTAFMCDGTAFVGNRGTITIYGAVHQTGAQLYAITGGTGDFRNARGQLQVRELSNTKAELTFMLLP